jgi:hypothetical protein
MREISSFMNIQSVVGKSDHQIVMAEDRATFRGLNIFQN